MSKKTGQANKKQKTKHYYCCFNANWLADENYKKWLIKIDEQTARCTGCKSTFTVKHDGEGALKSHLKTTGHKNWLKEKSTNQLLTAFVPQIDANEKDNITIIEVAYVYHGVSHHRSYRSMECDIKLNTRCFKDSKLGKKVSCARTKCETIAENVLGPKSVEDYLRDLGVNTLKEVSFSISLDVSSKGNQKLFLLTVKFFDVSHGIKNRLIDFYENHSENSANIINNSDNSFRNCGLDISNVNAYSADNANVNYVIHNSVFQKLILKNPNILKANCNCHVIHNAGRNTCKCLSFDFETLVLKVFVKLSNSSKKVNS